MNEKVDHDLSKLISREETRQLLASKLKDATTKEELFDGIHHFREAARLNLDSFDSIRILLERSDVEFIKLHAKMIDELQDLLIRRCDELKSIYRLGETQSTGDAASLINQENTVELQKLIVSDIERRRDYETIIEVPLSLMHSLPQLSLANIELIHNDALLYNNATLYVRRQIWLEDNSLFLLEIRKLFIYFLHEFHDILLFQFTSNSYHYQQKYFVNLPLNAQLKQRIISMKRQTLFLRPLLFADDLSMDRIPLYLALYTMRRSTTTNLTSYEQCKHWQYPLWNEGETAPLYPLFIHVCPSFDELIGKDKRKFSSLSYAAELFGGVGDGTESYLHQKETNRSVEQQLVNEMRNMHIPKFQYRFICSRENAHISDDSSFLQRRHQQFANAAERRYNQSGVFQNSVTNDVAFGRKLFEYFLVNIQELFYNNRSLPLAELRLDIQQKITDISIDHLIPTPKWKCNHYGLLDNPELLTIHDMNNVSEVFLLPINIGIYHDFSNIDKLNFRRIDVQFQHNLSNLYNIMNEDSLLNGNVLLPTFRNQLSCYYSDLHLVDSQHPDEFHRVVQLLEQCHMERSVSIEHAKQIYSLVIQGMSSQPSSPDKDQMDNYTKQMVLILADSSVVQLLTTSIVNQLVSEPFKLCRYREVLCIQLKLLYMASHFIKHRKVRPRLLQKLRNLETSGFFYKYLSCLHQTFLILTTASELHQENVTTENDIKLLENLFGVQVLVNLERRNNFEFTSIRWRAKLSNMNVVPLIHCMATSLSVLSSFKSVNEKHQEGDNTKGEEESEECDLGNVYGTFVLNDVVLVLIARFLNAQMTIKILDFYIDKISSLTNRSLQFLEGTPLSSLKDKTVINQENTNKQYTSIIFNLLQQLCMTETDVITELTRKQVPQKLSDLFSSLLFEIHAYLSDNDRHSLTSQFILLMHSSFIAPCTTTARDVLIPLIRYYVRKLEKQQKEAKEIFLIEMKKWQIYRGKCEEILLRNFLQQNNNNNNNINFQSLLTSKDGALASSEVEDGEVEDENMKKFETTFTLNKDVAACLWFRERLLIKRRDSVALLIGREKRDERAAAFITLQLNQFNEKLKEIEFNLCQFKEYLKNVGATWEEVHQSFARHTYVYQTLRLPFLHTFIHQYSTLMYVIDPMILFELLIKSHYSSGLLVRNPNYGKDRTHVHLHKRLFDLMQISEQIEPTKSAQTSLINLYRQLMPIVLNEDVIEHIILILCQTHNYDMAATFWFTLNVYRKVQITDIQTEHTHDEMLGEKEYHLPAFLSGNRLAVLRYSLLALWHMYKFHLLEHIRKKHSQLMISPRFMEMSEFRRINHTENLLKMI
ncbi:hypothetical protein SNEBB_001729 [Seison nebaliae]|nr:hypothetical protein SNEBB_001729 [Seison nebaliae]